MRDVMFQELRACNQAVRTMEDAKAKAKAYQILMETIEKLCELSNVGRKEGLLALEEAIYCMDELHNSRFLKKMMMLVVDGVNPELVESINTSRYFALGLEGVEALQYILMLQGSLSIQAGENPRILEDKLFAFAPEDLVEQYEKAHGFKFEQPTKQKDYDTTSLEPFYQGGLAVVPGDESYFMVKVADYAICSLDDRQLQRWLRDVENGDIAVAMKALSGECRRRIFTNMSERLALMIAEDMNFMGPVRIKDATDAVWKVFNVLIKLISYGEIMSPDEKAFRLFHDLFDTPEDDVRAMQMEITENELLQLMKEYTSTSNRRINHS